MSSNTSEMQVFSPPNHPPIAPTFSQISIVPISPTANLVSIAGQVGATFENASTVPFRSQVENALANVDTCLAAAGAKKKDIILVRQYVVKLLSRDSEDVMARGQTYIKWWKDSEGDRPPPPSTLIGVDSLAGKDIDYEIEVSVVVQRSE